MPRSTCSVAWATSARSPASSSCWSSAREYQPRHAVRRACAAAGQRRACARIRRAGRRDLPLHARPHFRFVISDHAWPRC
jgi:hypothetical protein